MFKVFKRLTSGMYNIPKSSHKNLLEEIVKLEFSKTMTLYSGSLNSDTWYYTAQPNGSQKFPDFQVRFNTYIYNIECKSSHCGKPIWNCSFPQLECFYIFMRTSDGAIAVYQGQELISPEMYNALTEIKNSKEIKDLESKICKQLANIPSKTVFSYYIRDMFIQHTPIVYRMNRFSEITKQYIATNDHRKKNGQYFTGENIKKYIRDQIRLQDCTFEKCLEPSFGSGELLDILCDITEESNITGYEIETSLCESVSNVSNICIHNTDFLLADTVDTYDLIIANPPYNELNKCDNYSKYQQVYYDWIENKSNIYFLFIKKCIDLLKQDGIAIFIIPNTFKMSISCAKIRQYILNSVDIINIKNFGKFSKEVAQEVMCIIFKKQKSTNFYTCRINESILISESKEHTIYTNSIRNLNIEIHIGKIVWNQHKKFLGSSGVLLIYSSNMTEQNIITLYKNNKQYIQTDDKNIVKTPCLLLRRSVTNRNNFVPICYKLTKPAAIENHVFTIHGDKKILNQVYDSITNPRTGIFIKNVIGSTHLSIDNILDLPLYS